MAKLPTAPAVHTDKASRSTVTVACKIAVAAFEMQLCKAEEVYENTQTGPRKITQYVKTGEIVVVRGTAYPRGTPPEGFPDKPETVAGYALTRGVPRAFWDKWVEQHAQAPYVLSGNIYAFEADDDVRAQAKEFKSVKSGLEPLNPLKDDRAPKSTTKGVTSPEIEEDRKAKVEKALQGAAA